MQRSLLSSSSSCTNRLADEETLSGALLDIWLNGNEARLLDQRRVPFVFQSGRFDQESLPKAWRGRPLLAKPTTTQTIIRTVTNLFEPRFR